MELSEQGQRLLRVLVGEIRGNRIAANRPETFLGYGETIELLQLPPSAPRGETEGQTLQLNGLNDLARWIRSKPTLPKITGLIVMQAGPEALTPGGGYFKEYGIPRTGKEYAWWLDEARKSLEFNWSPFFPETTAIEVEVFDVEAIRHIGDVAEGALRELPVKIRQRSEKLRDFARKHFKSASPDGELHCAVCHWSKPCFLLTREIVEIHHTEEIETLPPEGRTLPINEALALLVPLCPTCHRILHAKPGGGNFTVAELQQKILRP